MPTAPPLTPPCWTPCKSHNIDVVVLAGFLSVLGEKVIAAYRNKIINVHPSLIPSFLRPRLLRAESPRSRPGPGRKADRCHCASGQRGVRRRAYPLQKAVAVQPGDTPEVLQKRVMVEAEWKLLPQALAMVCSDEV